MRIQKDVKLMQMAQIENAKRLPKYKVEVYPKLRESINSLQIHLRVATSINFIQKYEWVWVEYMGSPNTLGCLALHVIDHRPSGLFLVLFYFYDANHMVELCLLFKNYISIIFMCPFFKVTNVALN